MELKEVLDSAQIKVYSKRDVFLRLTALNLLNALIKKKEYKDELGYGLIKPNVMRLAIYLAKSGKTGLCDEVCFQPGEDCLYVRSHGLQFCFHAVNVKVLEEECPQLSNEVVKWVGFRLQPIAEPLYLLAKETEELCLGNKEVKERIESLVETSMV